MDSNEHNSTYYNVSYNRKQISPSGSQGSLNSPTSPKMVLDNNNMNVNVLSPRMGPQVGSPRNQSSPKRPQNGSISSLYNNIEEVSESSRPLSPPVEKQSIESLRKQTPSPSEGRKPQPKTTNLPIYIAGAIGDFQNPRQAPRP